MIKSKNIQNARLIQHRVSQKTTASTQYKNVSTLQNVIRFIGLILIEKIKEIKNNEKINHPLFIVAYDYFLKKYGFKKMADSKLFSFIESCFYYKENFKVKLFLKFYGCLKNEENLVEDFEFFIKSLAYLDESQNQGIGIINSFSTNKLLISYKISINAIKSIFLNDFDENEINKIELTFEKEKEKNENVIDFEKVIETLLYLQSKIKKKSIEELKEVYLVGDVDNNEAISFEEYILLFRQIEGHEIDIFKIAEFFFNKCDLYRENRKMMSFIVFSISSKENGYFSKKKINFFKNNVNEIDKIKNIEDLTDEWSSRKKVNYNIYKIRNLTLLLVNIK